MADATMPTRRCERSQYSTRVLPVTLSQIGHVAFSNPENSFLNDWSLKLFETDDASHLKEAAAQIRNTDKPVAFPTETVYGLGADATRSSAVSAIYAAKQRPADNPLIVHVSSVSQLRKLLLHGTEIKDLGDEPPDPVPRIYHTLIERFWPGPLTILLPLPDPSPLAPQVTAGLPTFAVRMPSSGLALALIKLSDVPLAAPSANASTRPSPTTAAHVLNDLDGRIDIILDGGPCEVGVESTVVDGLSDPPVILRPGGVSLEMLRQCPGWEKAVIGYRDNAEKGIPRAPGMKYKHYSPRAKVILVERALDTQILANHASAKDLVGIVTTTTWGGLKLGSSIGEASEHQGQDERSGTFRNGYLLQANGAKANGGADCVMDVADKGSLASPPTDGPSQTSIEAWFRERVLQVPTVNLGGNANHIARGLFSALRELDEKRVDVIFVEGISEDEGDAAAAVMNRLRKAAYCIEV